MKGKKYEIKDYTKYKFFKLFNSKKLSILII